MLKAIAEGRGRLVGGSHPSLAIDGLWCDFTATNDLVDNGLVRPSGRAASLTPSGRRVPAPLTT